MVAPQRQERPIDAGQFAGGSRCPFCPGSGKVPDKYTVLAYDNDYPALKQDSEPMHSPEPAQDAGLAQHPWPSQGPGLGPAPPPAKSAVGPYITSPAYGKCEVILYSPKHESTLSSLPLDHVQALVDLWAARSSALSRDPRIKYIFLFENRGAEVGVTLHHPHGQLYAYPFIPLKVATELKNCRDYYRKQGRCLLCDMNREERDSGERMIAENDHFLCYLPFFTDYPFGAFIVAKRHVTMVPDLAREERRSLAEMLKDLVGGFDRLFEKPFPYMMCVHQGPVNEPAFQDHRDYYHLHIEFYPPLRDAGKVKHYASSEMGAWAACNPLLVEETAAKLRQAYQDARSDRPVGER